jgi:peroxiredoxin Q/BCP
MHSFDHPLLSDSDGTVSTQFGVRRRFGPLLTERTTFVIDTDRKVLDVVKSELRMSVHADRALEARRARA